MWLPLGADTLGARAVDRKRGSSAGNPSLRSAQARHGDTGTRAATERVDATLRVVAQTKKQIEAVLAGAGSRPRHRFGQNFMIEPGLVRAIADAGEIASGDTVIEVGPGTGTLTEELLGRVGTNARVVAVEIDRDLSAALRGRFAADGRFTLIEGDALAGKHGLNPELSAAIEVARGATDTGGQAASGATGTGYGAAAVRLVANLPYNIASPLVVELLLAGVDLLAFTVQKEVADRLRAGPAAGKAYGPLSVIVQTLADVEVLRTIPPTAFWPRPKIDSALVRLRRRIVEPALVGRERAFGRFVTAVFSQRRKTLRRALGAVVTAPAAPLSAAGLSGDERPEQIEVGRLQALFFAVPSPG